MEKRIAIVTGASSGIGREFAIQLGKCMKTIEEIWVVARREERLLALEREIDNIKVRIFSMDICRREDLNVFYDTLMVENPSVRVLVNAAGVGRAGCFVDLSREEIENMVDLNMKALAVLTHMVIPYMAVPSNLIQVASASAFMPQREFSVYAASKAFVLSFSRALRAELLKEGIKVTIVCPGPVATEFLEISNRGRKEKMLKRMVTVKPEAVVFKALRDAKAGKEFSIYGTSMKLAYAGAKLLPHRIFL